MHILKKTIIQNFEDFIKKSWIFKIELNLRLLEANFSHFDCSLNNTKFWWDQFSRLDVYWIQTNKHPPEQTKKQTNKLTNRQAKYVYR